MKLTLLGTGSPVPSAQKCSAGYMVKIGTDLILMDVGPGTVYRLVQAGRQVTDVTHVFLSHLHFDHWLDLIRLVLNRWDMAAPGLPPLKIYGPKGLLEIVERLFGPDGALKLDLTARTKHPLSIGIYESRGGTGPRPWPELDVTELRESDVIAGTGWTMRFANVPHTQPYLISFGMRLEDDRGVLAYSSDITCDPGKGAPKGLRDIAQDADVLIQYINVFGEALVPHRREDSDRPEFHTMIAAMARDARVDTMITSHHGPHLDRPGIRERVIADIAAIYPGKIIWGEDLQQFTIGTSG